MKLQQPQSVKQIAEMLGAAYFGDAEFPITGINEIHKVMHGDLTFVDVAKYYKKALESAASVVIINQKTYYPEGKSIIVSANPFDDYNKLVAYFSTLEIPAQNMKNFYVQGDNVSVGNGTTIYAGTVLGNHIKIGDNCTIYPNVTIYDNTTIGDNVIIHANTVIGSHAFYYKNKKTHYEKLLSCGSVIIANNVEIGAGCTIDKGVSGDTIIGEGSKLDNHIHIGHGVVLGKRVLIAAQCGIGGKTIIEDEVVIWGQVGITKDVTIGKGAVILAQSGVGKSLVGGKVYFGSPVQENRKALKDMVYLRRLDELFDGK